MATECYLCGAHSFMPQRSVCRVLFLTLCVLPTLAVAGWTARRMLPGVLQSRLAVLVEPLGAELACEAMVTPRPGVIRLQGVTILDAELGLSIAQCDWLEARQTRGAVAVQAGVMRVKSERLIDLGRMIDRGMREEESAAITLRLDELQIASNSSGVSTWRHVHAVLPPADPQLGPELTLRGMLAGQSDETSLVVTRNRQMEPPTTRVALATGKASIDADLLTPMLPWESLNAGASFAGEITVTLGAESQGDLSGRWSELNLAQSLSLPSQALQFVESPVVEIDQLRWDGERITSLKGQAAGGAGTIDRSAVYSANAKLQCAAGDTLVAEWQASPEGPIEFDRIALALELDATGVRLRGLLGTPAGNCMLARGDMPLLYGPQARRLPIASLLGFIAPADAPLRPTGSRVEAFARRLPQSSDTAGPTFRTQRP